MFLISMFFLFAATCVGGWLVFFPAGREAAWRATVGAARRLARGLAGAHDDGLRGASSAVRRGREQLAGGVALLRRHPVLTALVAGLVLLPPLAVLLAGDEVALPGFDGATPAVNHQVAGLLRGERLAAPQPLPPAVFTTAEVTLARPMLAGANRNFDLLDGEFAQRLLTVFRVMREQHGYDMVLLEGYRSPERQNQLADAGGHVTNARAFQSYHQFGLAGDCAFLRNGRVVITEKDPWAMRGYRLYGEVAEAAGLTWGGRWKMMDFGHTELRRPRR